MLGRFFLTLALFFLSVSQASADRFYAGADIIVTNLEDSIMDQPVQDRPTGLRLLAGYSFKHYLAIEGAFFDTGEADDSVVSGTENIPWTGEMSGYVLSLVLQTDETTPNLFTKLGYHKSDVDISRNGVNLDEDDDGFAASVGFRHNIFYNNLALRGAIEVLESDHLDNVWSAGIGLELSFGK